MFNHHIRPRMNRTLKSSALALVAISSMLALTACGGGGGSAPTNANPTAPAAPAPTIVISDAGNLQTAVPAASYAAGSAEAEAFATVNTLRQAAGAGLVAQSAQIDVAAGAHAKYLTTHILGLQDYHNEDSSKVDYYARTPGDRLIKAGFSWSNSTEVIGGTGASLKAADCVKGLLNTVYHGAAILSSNSSVGVGIGLDAAKIPMCVADFGTPASDKLGQVPAAGKFIGYPHAAQTGVDGTFYVANETPRPSSTLFPNATAGTPVIVSLRNADYLNYAASGALNPSITTFRLKDAAGNIVPSAILANPALKGDGITLNADQLLAEGFAVLVPLAPLSSGQTYSVDFSATLKAGGAALKQSWTFTTASSAGSNSSQSSSSAGQSPGVGTFALDNVSAHSSNGTTGDQITITVRNIGTATINSASLVCGGASFFGGISGQTLPPNGTLSVTCVAAASGAYNMAHILAVGTNASNAGIGLGPF
jgi:uncharacterized protein YkwD